MKIKLDLSLNMGKNEFKYQGQVMSLRDRYFFFTENSANPPLKPKIVKSWKISNNVILNYFEKLITFNLGILGKN